MRRDEELCRNAVDTLLRSRGAVPEWHEGSEPPDYFLHSGGQRLAVEVTSIHGRSSVAGKKDNWTKLTSELLTFGGDLCSEVEGAIKVAGRFLVAFPPLHGLKKRRDEVRQSLLRYLETSGQTTTVLGSDVLYTQDGRDVVIRKISSAGSALVAQALPAGAFVSHRENLLGDLLASAIVTKREKLRSVSEAAILIILDHYGFERSLERWHASLPEDAAHFQAVVRVWGGSAEVVSGALPDS